LYRQYRQRMKPDTSIGYPNGYQKNRKSNGLRGFSSGERREKGLFQSEQELGEWGFQDKEYNRHRQVKVDVEDTPRNLRRSEKREYFSLLVYFSFGFDWIFGPFSPTKTSESRKNNNYFL
jgi:hypothetical protein